MHILQIMNVILKEPQATEGSHGILRYAQNDNKMVRQSGNAVLIILLGVALFGALSYTFMRGSQTGQGNLTQQQAKLAAQELATFVNTINRAFQKLRSRGCSESDISFAYTGTNGTFGTAWTNHPATAPVDYSCHIFRPEGAGLTFSIDPEKYQVSYDIINTTAPASVNQHDNIYFRNEVADTIGVGTAASDLMMHFNFIKPEICKAYNQIIPVDIDLTIEDTGPTAGDENPQYAGKETFCRSVFSGGEFVYGQIRYVWIAH